MDEEQEQNKRTKPGRNSRNKGAWVGITENKDRNNRNEQRRTEPGTDGNGTLPKHPRRQEEAVKLSG